MEWARPGLLYLSLALLPVLFLSGLWISSLRKRDWRALAGLPFMERLVNHLSPARRRLKRVLFGAGLFLMILAWAGPQFGAKLVEVKRQGVDIMIALDVSRSMLAEDVTPSRLQRAQQELTALVDQLHGDRVGVVAFAGSAQVVCPLTTDYSAAKMFLNYLTPDSVPFPGTSLGGAVRQAVGSFTRGGEGFRVLVLLTDGEDHNSQPEAAAAEAKAAGVRILTIGIGTPGGEPIPERDANGQIKGYVKDRQGKTVVSRLDEVLLKRMAESTGGAYLPAHQGGIEADQVARLIDQMKKRDISAGEYGALEDRYQYLLALGILFLLAAFWLPARRRAWLLAVWFCLMGAGAPPSAQAGMPEDVYQGNRAYSRKQFEQAVQKYRDAQMQAPDSPIVNYNLANALHQSKQFEEADKAYQKSGAVKKSSVREKVLYNQGNNFIFQQKFSEAIKAYREALRLNPGDGDALYNLARAQDWLKNGPPKQPETKPDPKKNQDGNQNQSQPGSAGGTKTSESKSKPGKDEKDRPANPQGPDDKGEKKSGDQGDQQTPGQRPDQAARPGEMSPQAAENLLDAVRESEQNALRERLKNSPKASGRDQEDW